MRSDISYIIKTMEAVANSKVSNSLHSIIRNDVCRLSKQTITLMMIDYTLQNDGPLLIRGIRDISRYYDLPKTSVAKLFNRYSALIDEKLAKLVYQRMFLNSKQLYDVGTELSKSDVNMLITARNKILKMTSKTFERKCEKSDFITKLLWK